MLELGGDPPIGGGSDRLMAVAETLPTSAQLDAFLGELRRADFSIGPDQIAGAQKILLLAHAEAEGGLAARRLKTMLAPILARTPTQQSDFYRRFDAMMAGVAPAPTTRAARFGDLLGQRGSWLRPPYRAGAGSDRGSCCRHGSHAFRVASLPPQIT